MTDTPQITQGSLMNALPVGIGVLTKGEDGFEFQNANIRLRKMFNLKEQVSLNQLLGQENGKKINELSRTAGGEELIQHHDKWYSITLTSYEEGAWLAIVKDITDLKSMVFKARAEIQKKEHFLAMMSHEIRTPMQSIFGLLELISDEKGLSDDANNMLNTAKNSATSLLAILDDILDIAKVEAGKLSLDVLEVPLRTLAYGVVECMEVKLQGNNVKLVTEIAEDVPPVVTGDPSRLRQILLNLVGNAMKFTDRGEICLRISTQTEHIRAKGKDGISLRFEILDTGIGMPQEVADRLFAAFEQADNSTGRKFGGTGLGLSICQKLVHLMDGVIGVTSVEGQGSNFWFEIPASKATGEMAQDLPDLNGIAVLSVEDHPNGAKEIARTLTSRGADVTSVGTFADGLKMAKSRRFDVAMIDQGLPDGLGINLLKDIAALQPYAGLIMYTVRDDYGLQHSVQTMGGRYLSKPASRLGLTEAVLDASRTNIAQLDENRPRRLLIAEDTQTVRDVLKRQLKKLNVEADFVDNGLQALEMLREGRHGILFTDLHMPEIDGFELVKRLRAMEEQEGIAKNDGFPVVVLTADVQMAQRQAYLSYGFNECLLKPVSLGQFRQLLVRWGLLDENAMREQAAIAQMKEAAAAVPEKKMKKETVFIDGETADIELADPAISHLRNKADDIDEPAINMDALREIVGEMDDGIKTMLRDFVNNTEPQLDALEKAIDNNDYKKLIDLTNSLKGAARSACCLRLGGLIDQLHQYAIDKEKPSSRLMDDIIMEFARVQREVAGLK